jgi:uncharacterized protein
VPAGCGNIYGVPRDQLSVFRAGDVSYLRIPAPDPPSSAAFYRDVFGWRVRVRETNCAFEDASGLLIGHFVSDQAPLGADGVRPYVYVESVSDTLAELERHGGEVVQAPYPEGDLTVATFRDPAGNVVGVWSSEGKLEA